MNDLDQKLYEKYVSTTSSGSIDMEEANKHIAIDLYCYNQAGYIQRRQR